VVYGSGNKKTGKRTPPPREKKPRRTGGKRRLPLRRSAALAIAAVILILIYILVHKNGTAVFVAEETVGILEGRSYKAEQIIHTDGGRATGKHCRYEGQAESGNYHKGRTYQQKKPEGRLHDGASPAEDTESCDI
jgi:hypothetical protein